MGSREFTSFFLQNSAFSKTFKLHDSTVIVDGNSLLHFLYDVRELDYVYGGEYLKYYDGIRRFLSSFLKCNIKPVVIIDGGYENSKQRTDSIIQRANYTLQNVLSINTCRQSSYPVFPQLRYEVFRAVLFDLRISFAVNDNGTIGQVAYLGNYYNCPIISNDSDFYILDANNGFINLESIDKTVYLEGDCHGNSYNFLKCKIYYIDEFVKTFPGLNKNILPLFGTLLGNDLIEHDTFMKLFSNVKVTGIMGENICWELRHKGMVGMLCWLRHKTLQQALNEVTYNCKKDVPEKVWHMIEIFVAGCKLNPCRLSVLFDRNNKEHGYQLLSKSKLITPCGLQLPKYFVLKYHQGFYPTFFINAICMHKVFLIPQVDDVENSSSYACSSYIRQILYGILVRHTSTGTGCWDKICVGSIEEYDRQNLGINIHKSPPIYFLPDFGLLPRLNELQTIEKEKCITVMAKTLGIVSDFFLSIPDEWHLIFASINYWLRNSVCKSEAFIGAVILNLIYFGFIMSKQPFSNKGQCQKKMATNFECDCSSIACILKNISHSDLEYAGSILKRYYVEPHLDSGKHIFLNFTHNFSELKSCLLYATFLNTLLNSYLKNPNPEKCFSGTMLFNLTNAISSTHTPDILIRDILGDNLNLLFSQMKAKICENV